MSWPLDPLDGLASNLSSQYHLWITHLGHKNKIKDHQLKKILIIEQIPPVNLGNA